MAAFDRRLLRRVRSTGQAAALSFVLGGLLFWLTGAGVKLVRIGLGLPPFPWSAFLGFDDLALEFAVAVFLSVPHFAVIAVGRRYVVGNGSGPWCCWPRRCSSSPGWWPGSACPSTRSPT